MEWLSCICKNKTSKIYFGNNDGIALIIFFDRKLLSPPAILNCDSIVFKSSCERSKVPLNLFLV